MLHASKTPDESGNYNHSVRVTYRLGFSISFHSSLRWSGRLKTNWPHKICWICQSSRIGQEGGASQTLLKCNVNRTYASRPVVARFIGRCGTCSRRLTYRLGFSISFHSSLRWSGRLKTNWPHKICWICQSSRIGQEGGASQTLLKCNVNRT